MFSGLQSLQSFEDARRMARRRLPALVFDYIDGAAGTGTGEARNRKALSEIALRPSVLRNVESRNLRTEILGQSYDLPFGIAPMGMCNLSWPGADLMLARLAAREAVPLGVSTVASTALETLIETAHGRAWFQLYFSGDGEGTFKLVERAKVAGYQTLVLTVDVPEVGRRPRELRQGFKMPFRLGLRAFTDFALHPQWSLTTLAKGAPKLGNFTDDFPGFDFDRTESRARADWDTLAKLRDHWPGKLVIKGVLNASDALRLKQAGVDAVQVSSHGGRQLDASLLPVQALMEIREAVGPDFPLFFDSGLRSGEDVLKIKALGANFGFFGRPLLMAIAAGGEAGLAQYWASLKDELSIGLAVLGLTSFDELNAETLA